MEKIHKHQVEKVLPYQYEPEAGAETSNFSDESDSEDGSVLSSSEEEVDTEFERANAWRLETLSWCKCGHHLSSVSRIPNWVSSLSKSISWFTDSNALQISRKIAPFILPSSMSVKH